MTNKEILQQAADNGFGWAGQFYSNTKKEDLYIKPFSEDEEEGEDLIKLIRSFIGEER